jgi:PKHD-type hydroxylase
MRSIKVFEKIMPHTACEQIIQEGVTRPQINAGIGKDNIKSEGRSTKVTFIDNPFIKSYIYELVTRNFKNYIIEEAEDLQFATYTKGDFYGLHKDADETNNRVLSVTVQLSKSSDYKGGDLIFDYDKQPMERVQGTVVIFPSYVYHEVTPVTKGKRYSLVQWFKGYESRNK